MKIHQAIIARLFFSAAAAMVFLMPDVAAAHLVTTGMGPVYDGIGHLLLTTEDLVPAIAVALYVGLRGKALGRRALFSFPLAWLAGGFAGLMITCTLTFPLPMLSFILLGGLIAADLSLPDNIVSTLVIVVGITHGFYNGTTMEGGPGISGLLGITATLFVLIGIASAFVVSLQAAWTRVAVRVAGSWIAAVGLLMLGWLVKGAGTAVSFFIIVICTFFFTVPNTQAVEHGRLIVTKGRMIDPAEETVDKNVEILIEDKKLSLVTEDTIAREDTDLVVDANKGVLECNFN